MHPNISTALVNKVSPSRETDAPDQGIEVSLTRLLAQTIEDMGYPEGNAAKDMDYRPNYWSRIKSGEKAAHLERISRLPRRVQREFLRRYAAELKMDVRRGDAQKRAIAELACALSNALREIV